VTVHQGPTAAYLEVHENAAPGWSATLNGQTLKAVTLDGWQQGFLIPAGAGGAVHLTYTPQTWYVVALSVGGFLLLLVLATAVLAARRERTGASAPSGARLPAAAARASQGPTAGLIAGPLVGVVVLALVGGPMAGAVVVLGALWWWRPGLARIVGPAVAVAAMTAAGLIAAVDVQHGLTPGQGAFSTAAQACALAALAAALAPWDSPRRARTPSSTHPSRRQRATERPTIPAQPAAPEPDPTPTLVEAGLLLSWVPRQGSSPEGTASAPGSGSGAARGPRTGTPGRGLAGIPAQTRTEPDPSAAAGPPRPPQGSEAPPPEPPRAAADQPPTPPSAGPDRPTAPDGPDPDGPSTPAPSSTVDGQSVADAEAPGRHPDRDPGGRRAEPSPEDAARDAASPSGGTEAGPGGRASAIPGESHGVTDELTSDQLPPEDGAGPPRRGGPEGPS
jgi:arabinofuranan 3-O-arabinosyltransferase